MTMVLLLRHGLTAATGKALAGRTPGVPLDDRGREQATAAAARLAPVRLGAIVSSPIQRCAETAAIIAAARPAGNGDAAGPPVTLDERLTECGYGDWTGKPLRKLAAEPMWRVVQAHPSAARFPGPDGEAMADMAHRAVAAVRDWNHALGADATYLICSHGDVIKAILADALGLHLDLFQRISVDPCSLSVVRYTGLRPFVERLNDSGGGVAALIRREPQASQTADAVVGGGAGE
jgi:probable phosphoglycerate mutase